VRLTSRVGERCHLSVTVETITGFVHTSFVGKEDVTMPTKDVRVKAIRLVRAHAGDYGKRGTRTAGT
jgi:hypothetical protein